MQRKPTRTRAYPPLPLPPARAPRFLRGVSRRSAARTPAARPCRRCSTSSARCSILAPTAGARSSATAARCCPTSSARRAPSRCSSHAATL
eukprot:2764823-Pleurochrysis_carterae.AAC.1